MTSWNNITQNGIMEVFLQNLICLNTTLQILLKIRRLGLVYMVSRVLESQLTMSSINAELRIG